MARGIRWRPMGSLLVVITAAIAVGTAVVGPLFLRAGGDSLVRRTVAGASVSKTRLALTSASHSSSLDGLTNEQRSLLASEHLTGLYGPSVVKTMQSTILLTSASREVYLGRLTYRSGICSVLHFSAGGCRAGPDDAVLSDRSARELGVSVGSTITVNNRKSEDPVGIRITGVYRLPNLQSAYWFGEPGRDFPFGKNSLKPLELDEVDDVFVASPAAFALPPSYSRSFAIQTALRSGALGIGNASAVMGDMLTLKRRAALAGFELESGLSGLLVGPLHQQSLMNTVVVVAAVQLVLLAIWVLTSALMRSADLRRSELRIARLRGFPLSTLLAVSITEPAALCAIGVVLGILGAWGGVIVAASILFAPGTTVGLDGWTFVGFGAVVLTICAVLALSSARLLRRVGLASSPSRSVGSRSRVVVDVSILALSVVAVLGAATSGALSSHSNPVAAAAPAVVALGTSVIAIRIVELLCRRLSAATLDSSAVAVFLAVRQVGRRPTALREGRTLVIAVALACFAVSAWSVARTNRLTAATFAIGARSVVTVTAHDRRLEQAVDAVDPHGSFAMAAIQVAGPGNPVIGLDANRLAAVAAWPTGTTRESVAAVGRALTSRKSSAVDLPDGTLAVAASVSASGVASQVSARLHVAAWLFNPVAGTFTVDLGRLRTGRFTYEGGAQKPCPCRLVGLGVLSSANTVPSSGEIHLGVDALTYRSGAGAPHAAHAELTPAVWRSSLTGVRVAATGSQVAIDVPMTSVAGDVGFGGNPPVMASVAGAPSVLPAVAGGFADSLAAGSGQYGTLSVQGPDGYNISVRPAVVAASLPRIGPSGVIVDLGTLERAQTAPTFSETTEEVWLGPRAPANAISRLRAAGLRIDQVQRSSALVSQAQHTGPALAYDFMLLAMIVALLVAAVGTFSVLAAGGRGRATEMVALEVTGVPRGILARSLAIEAGILALTALFGVAAGAGSAAIALPSLPQLATATDAPLSYALPVSLLLAAAAGAVLVVMAATALAARGILANMSPTLLRTAADDVD
ncbi:MAG TPA: FtsX-like permease family protein [Solirubrobacteraceae bacterium]|nr:FtsX-like permease family protein [Solirubrobacteraceae bacterium]